MVRHKKILKGGRWWLPPSPGRGESCLSVFARGLFVHQKCLSYELMNLLFGLCRSVWVIDLLITLLNPYLEAPTHPFTPKVLRAREHSWTPHSSIVFTLDSHLSLLRSLGVHHMTSTTLYNGILTSWNGNGKVTFANNLKFIEIDKVLVGISF